MKKLMILVLSLALFAQEKAVAMSGGESETILCDPGIKGNNIDELTRAQDRGDISEFLKLYDKYCGHCVEGIPNTDNEQVRTDPKCKEFNLKDSWWVSRRSWVGL